MAYMLKIWVNIGSGNGLLPDGTKPEPVVTDHQLDLREYIWIKVILNQDFW